VALLELSGMNRYFGGLHAVNDVSFQVDEGQIKAIIGPNGAGKTTLFNLISGNLKPASGTSVFLGRDITHLKPHEIARSGMSRTFQSVKLWNHMTVLENIMIGRHVRSRGGFFAGMLSLPWTLREERACKDYCLGVLELLSLETLAHEEASNLPFGRQRAVEFARALASEPKLLLLDEPAAGLNLHETDELAKLILEIRRSGITILLVEHDMSLVMDIADEILVLDSGRTIAEGPPRAIQRDPAVVRIYLGEDYA
jgi:branched-chain amino acid transport system ATP-binding protein